MAATMADSFKREYHKPYGEAELDELKLYELN